MSLLGDVENAAASVVSSLLGGSSSGPGDPVAIQARFSVTVDGIELGYFSKVEGLGVTVKTDKFDQGGTHNFSYVVPSSLQWSDIKITRPVAQGNTDLAQLVAAGGDRTVAPIRHTAVITFFGVDMTPIMSWSVQGVLPTGWTGPTGDVGSTSAATETLTLSHHGFTFGAGSGGGLAGALAGAASAAIGAIAGAL
jgi:phage tail-like protein